MVFFFRGLALFLSFLLAITLLSLFQGIEPVRVDDIRITCMEPHVIPTFLLYTNPSLHPNINAYGTSFFSVIRLYD